MAEYKERFDKLLDTLWEAHRTKKAGDAHALVGDAIQQAEILRVLVLTDAQKRGSKGGTKTAERGPGVLQADRSHAQDQSWR